MNQLVEKFGPNFCLYCLNCTKFGQLILRKIIEIVATRCQILRLKCTKFNFSMGEITALPRPLAGFKGPTSKKREGRKKRARDEGGEGDGRGRGWRGRGKGKGGEGKGEGIWRGPETGMPRGPHWLSAGLQLYLFATSLPLARSLTDLICHITVISIQASLPYSVAIGSDLCSTQGDEQISLTGKVKLHNSQH